MSGEINCDALQRAMKQGRALTTEEQAHLESCGACADAWLDGAVMKALEAKPEVRVPEGFAAKVMVALPEKTASTAKNTRRYGTSWGLVTAAALVAVGLVAAAVADPGLLTTRMGMIFEGLAAAEIAGIALWLGLMRQRAG